VAAVLVQAVDQSAVAAVAAVLVGIKQRQDLQ
jgi:hypothetical protein